MSTWSESCVVIIYAVCDECSTGCDSHDETKAAAIESAKAAGWKMDKGRVLCPECQKTVGTV